ncbi:hypothetical protein Pint_24983 [Pistacia integerrima]|uniref:Uncharacterized protein n=1 Tax=Pistacia integerrima TaxID=434235 RepID=A0ACC0YAN3_9ROSI|nr:hypothetical protein Pint_24983 [Pistacia integerrima]
MAKLTVFAKLVKPLPTGTIFTFLFLCPLLTNEGNCDTINKCLATVLVFFCGFSCFFSCFTDSYRDSDGHIHYGIVTTTGLWPHKHHSTSVNLSNYKLRFSDFVHALMSAVVFSVVVLLYPDIIECFYSFFQRALLVKWLPFVTGFVTVMYSFFPNNRHGLGYIPSDYPLLS